MRKITVNEQDAEEIEGHRRIAERMTWLDPEGQEVSAEKRRDLDHQRGAVERANAIARLDAVDRLFDSMKSQWEQRAAVEWIRERYRLDG